MDSKLKVLDDFITVRTQQSFKKMTTTTKETTLKVIETQKEVYQLQPTDLKSIEDALTRWENDFIPEACGQMVQTMSEFVRNLSCEEYLAILDEA